MNCLYDLRDGVDDRRFYSSSPRRFYLYSSEWYVDIVFIFVNGEIIIIDYNADESLRIPNRRVFCDNETVTSCLYDDEENEMEDFLLNITCERLEHWINSLERVRSCPYTDNSDDELQLCPRLLRYTRNDVHCWADYCHTGAVEYVDCRCSRTNVWDFLSSEMTANFGQFIVSGNECFTFTPRATGYLNSNGQNYMLILLLLLHNEERPLYRLPLEMIEFILSFFHTLEEVNYLGSR